MGPIVFCPNGHVFESRGFRIENARHVTLQGNRETCPSCGAMAEIMDGEFDFIRDTITVLSAPQITINRLQALERLLRQGADRPPEEVVRAIGEEAPDLGATLLRTLLPSDPSKLREWLLVLLAVIQLLISLQTLPMAEQAGTPSEVEIEQIVRNVINSELSHSQPTPPPEPPAPQPDRQMGPRPPVHPQPAS
ncbi:MAG: hypothetical protein HKL82_11025 [Acidimicrobiaceae bacterium]|nr:hypothetical protein [Acidimicrobiaceae bacterium]